MNNSVLRRMRASSNAGPGIWLDIFNTNNVIEGCFSDANDQAGFFIEHGSDNNLIQHNIGTFTWHIGASEATGFLQRASRRNYIYHNSFFNNRLQGIFLNDDSRVDGTDPYTDWLGHESYVHNNLTVGNGIEGIFPSGIGTPVDGGREMHIEDRCHLGLEAIRTNSLNGNVYYSHDEDDDSHYDQDDPLYWSFRVRPDELASQVNCVPDPLAPVTSTNSILTWRSKTQEGTSSYMVFEADMATLNVDIEQLSYPGPNNTPNPNWLLLAFPVTNDVSCLPSCTGNPDCVQHPYSNAGANPSAVFGTWLDSAPSNTCRASFVAGANADTGRPLTPALTLASANPFSTSTTFRLDLPSTAHVAVEVFDVTGRRVKMLLSSEMEAGRHLVNLVGHGLADGTYLVRAVMTTGEAQAHTFTRHVTLIR